MASQPKAFSELLNEHRDWAVVIAARAALRVLPVLSHGDDEIDPSLPLAAFRAVSIARFVSMFPARGADAIGASSSAAKMANRFLLYAASNAANTAYAANAGGDYAGYASKAIAAYAADFSDLASAAISDDMKILRSKKLSSQKLARKMLWPQPDKALPIRIRSASQQLSAKLLPLGEHWKVWIDWYDKVLSGERDSSYEEWQAAFTDIPGSLPWSKTAEAVNTEIYARIERIRPSRRSAPQAETRSDSEVRAIAERIEQNSVSIERLAAALSQRLDVELDRLKGEIPNEPSDLKRHNLYVEFLSSLASDIKKIQYELQAAQDKSLGDRKIAYQRASNIVHASAARITSYIEKNADQFVDYTAKTFALGAGCYFLTACNAPAEMAFPVLAGLLGGEKLIGYIKSVRTNKKRSSRNR